MKDVTLLIAHPDDEALFCWPVLDRVKKIICASDDSANPERIWCKERGKCLEDVGRLLGAEVIHLPYNSEFYRLSTRDGQLKRLAEILLGHLLGAEIVFTHNAWGEYGNLDHILCHYIGRTWQASSGCQLMTSNIAISGRPAWLPLWSWDQIHDSEFEGPTDHLIDQALFKRIKALYDARSCWTWSWEPVEKCRVYSL